MKILWISDFCLKHTKGGAQRSDDIIIQHGLKKGLDITWFNHDSDPALLDQKYDHVISTNLEQISKTSPHLNKLAPTSPNHSRLEHDMNSLSVSPRQADCYSPTAKILSSLPNITIIYSKMLYGNFFKNVKLFKTP